LTEQILTNYKARIRALTLIPSDGGRFEFSIDGALVYSKLATGKFPEWAQIQREIDARMK
jgi:selT/selW/selH-like putative selenoprotein